MLKRDDPEKQLVYYQTGIGTYTPPGFASKLVSAVAKGLDEAFAWYLEEHVVSLGGSASQLPFVSSPSPC